MKTLLMSGFSWSHLLLRTNLFPSNSTQAFGWQLWSCDQNLNTRILFWLFGDTNILGARYTPIPIDSLFSLWLNSKSLMITFWTWNKSVSKNNTDF